MTLKEFAIFLQRTMAIWSGRIDTQAQFEPVLVSFQVKDDAGGMFFEQFKFSTSGIVQEPDGNADIIITGKVDLLQEIIENPERIEARVLDGSVRVLGNVDKVTGMRALWKKVANEPPRE